MVDTLTKEQRSKAMASVKGKNTRPEVRVRSLLHRMGYRFRLHHKGLPGKPDIVLPKYRTCIFVHGCFWHQHPGCKKASRPKTNEVFWHEKLDKNIERDRAAIDALIKIDWRVAVIWECETKSNDALLDAISRCFAH